ncbi:leucine--tRNA ligase [Candidatus Micrarchaeota archaeon]|nr:leucine--tRNA ligase [Candidatus Micrarchaeota archaeon]
MDFSAVESKWSRRWTEEKAFHADPGADRKKKYITAAFPYPNSPQHIGHARTYTTADIYARYLRLKGYNVLFPMAFHVTGTPIIAMAKRIREKDEAVLAVFENIYGIPRKTAESLSKPEDLVRYFSDEIEKGMKEMGYSIDWRRKFYSYDEKFNRFIQWQFRKLQKMGYLVKGEYPIAWCPEDQNPLSAHDTKGDIDPELEDVTVIKFRANGESLVVTTYRPETVYGATNIWINPDAEYVRVNYMGETIIMAKKAAEVLQLQTGHEVTGDISAHEVLKMKPVNPINGKEVPVYSASFVNPETGTGIVMSVPAHAPKDYLALRDIGKGNIDMPQVIELKGYSKNPARDAVEELGVKNQDDPLAEKATKEIYTREAHEGAMAVGRYRGEPVAVAKEKVAKDLISADKGFEIVTIANGPVYCRCGCHAVVNVIKDQWFVDYGIPEWKEKAKECLESMSVVPENARSEFLYTIDWLKTRPCTRSTGLGTKFPFDESKVIEALSDSTLYMAFYTISHLLEDIPASEMDDGFFDYVFLGRGEGSEKLEKLRESFLYWYPCDSRHSAGDLVRNHLTLYIFNHVALMKKEHWPAQIVTNGFVLMDGSKMSKSMGNILPLRKAIREYGADVIRFAVISGADLSSDTDFNQSVADGVRSRLSYITKLIQKSGEAGSKPHGRIDRWLLSRLNRKIENAESLYNQLSIRHLGLEIFYGVVSDLQWYMKRAEEPNLHEFFQKWVVMIAPFMPHYAEEYWEILGNSGLATFREFPEADQSRIDKKLEKGEELIKKVHQDIEKISGLIGKKPSRVTIYVAGEGKGKIFRLVKKHKIFEKVMAAAAAEGLPMKSVQKVVKQLIKNAHALPEILSQDEELAALIDARQFFSREFDCMVEILPEEEGKHPKAESSLPDKPSIVLE